MKNEQFHKVLSFTDWPKVPNDAPVTPDPALDVNLATVVREVLESVRHENSPAFVERLVRIRNFRSAKYRLVEDLVVMIEATDDIYIARSYDTGQYGLGASSDDAIEHLCAVLEDYYELLQEDRGKLSRPLESHLRYLDIVLRSL